MRQFGLWSQIISILKGNDFVNRHELGIILEKFKLSKKNMFSQNEILAWKSFSERFKIHHSLKTMISFDYVNFN